VTSEEHKAVWERIAARKRKDPKAHEPQFRAELAKLDFTAEEIKEIVERWRRENDYPDQP
jgi:hypothetical protein